MNEFDENEFDTGGMDQVLNRGGALNQISSSPIQLVQDGRSRLQHLTALKEQQARVRAAMEQMAQVYGREPYDPTEVALGAFGKGMVSAPGRSGTAFINAMSGFNEAKAKLAERQWSREAAAAKARAEMEQQGISDILNLSKTEKAMLPDWKLAQTEEGPVLVAADATGQLHTRPIGGSTKTRDQMITIMKGIDKRADELDEQFLKQSGNNPSKASELKQQWKQAQYNADPVLRRISGDVVPPSGEKPVSKPMPIAMTAPVRDIPSEEGRKTESKEVGEIYGKEFGTYRKASESAQTKLDQYQRLDNLLEGVNTGKLTPYTTELSAWAKSIGETLNIPSLKNIDPKLPNKEAANTISQALALELRDPSGGAGMPGAMSDADREFLMRMVPSLSTTPEGRRLMVQYAMKAAERTQTIAELAEKYRKENGSLEGFSEVKREYVKNHPLFHKKMDGKDIIVIRSKTEADSLKKGDRFIVADDPKQIVRTKP